MSWPGPQEIAAGFAVLAVLAVVVTLIPRPYCWPVLLVVAGLAVIPLVRGDDFPVPAFWLTVAALVVCVAYLAVDIGRSPARVRRDATLTIVCTLGAIWLWVRIGAPVRLPAAVGFFLVPCFAIVAWTLSGHRAAGKGAGRDGDLADQMVTRDRRFLEALYNATHGEVGRRVPVQDLIDYVELPTDQAIVAAERLLSKKYIEEVDGTYALRRAGAETMENKHGGVTTVTSGDTFKFKGNPVGVFGSKNKVSGNTFTSNNAPVELIQELLTQSAAVREHVPAEQHDELVEAESEVREGSNDPGRLRRGAERLASIAKSIGEVGAPLLRAATDLIHAVTS